MTLRLIEGFDWLPTTADNATFQALMGQSHYYFASSILSDPATWDINTTTAFSYGNSLRVNYTDAQYDTLNQLYYPVGPLDEGYMGYRILVQPDHTGWLGMTFYDAVSGGNQISIVCRPNGMIYVYRGAPFSGTLLITSDPGSFYMGSWFYLEAYVKIHDTAGEVQVRVNTKVVIDLIASDTNATGRPYFDMVGMRGRNSSGSAAWVENQYFDDMYFCDTAGTVNNGYLGNVRVKTQFTTADGDNIDFLIGGSAPAATNWQSVQNTSLNLTKLVYSPTVGDYDLYEIDPNVNAPYVHAIQVRTGARQDDATQRVLHNLLKTPAGTLIEPGTDFYLNQTVSVHRDIIEINPDTATFFTGTEANGTQAGFKVDA